MSFLRPHYDFLQQLAWQRPATNALQYNTSTPGLVIPIVFGVLRIPSNLLGMGNYMGPGGGKKGKGVGSLPIGGTNTVAGKGGGGGKGKGSSGKGKKGGNHDFTVDADFGLCQGPISGVGQAYVNAQVADFYSIGLNLYLGGDGQAADGTMAGLGYTVGYSGTAHFAGNFDLGMSPVLPNVSVEVYGFSASSFPGLQDANAGHVVQALLLDQRWGLGFPAQYLDPDLLTLYGDYTVAANLPVSVVLDAQQKGTEWLDGLTRLTNTAVVCSGSLVRLIPYGDAALSSNGVSWTPYNNMTPVYALTDDNFLPWHPRAEDSEEPQTGEDDPVIMTRHNPADRDNWLTIQYKDRSNYYNDNVIPVFSQGHIDAYGRRDGETLPGKCFCSPGAAQISAQLILQRKLYVDTCKFKLGWQYGLLEPMDLVLLTDPAAGFTEAPFRIISRERNANGDLTFEAETAAGPGISDGCATVTSQATPGAPPTVDGTGGASGLALTSVTATITTTQPNDVILVLVQGFQTAQVAAGAPQIGSVSSPNLGAFRARTGVITAQLNAGGSSFAPWYGATQLLWAPAPNVLTNEPIKLTFSSEVVGGGLAVMAINGAANINSPFDPDPSLPAEQTYVSPTQTAGQVQVGGVSTTNSNDLIIGAAAVFSRINVAAGSGVALTYSAASGDGITQPFAGYAAECIIVAYPSGARLAGATLNTLVAFVNGQPMVTDNWIMIGDAITSS